MSGCSRQRSCTARHIVLDRGGKVFNRSAPVIKLPAGATEADHLALIGLLNSSTACFWMKQVFHNKGSTVDTRGARQTTDAFENFYEFTGTGLKKFPIPDAKPLDFATELDRIAGERQAHLPSELVGSLSRSRADLDSHRADAESLLRRMIALQEEFDWRCYRLYGVTEEDLTLGRNAAGGASVAVESAEPIPGSSLRVPEIGFGEGCGSSETTLCNGETIA
jgi:hypothetical protein